MQCSSTPHGQQRPRRLQNDTNPRQHVAPGERRTLKPWEPSVTPAARHGAGCYYVAGDGLRLLRG